MDRRFNGPTVPSSSTDGGATATFSHSARQPNYSSRAVQEALEHLASIDLIELCKESKVERCRATRDLRSCGRYVLHVLNSCGHASLCAECSQRCDICPICRIQIPISGCRQRLRLYYQCIEAGLISKKMDERFQEKEDKENQLLADIEHLYSFFDVALENNLVSLICHYVTEVCLDESAVSSNPVIAFLLDEVVVKDWCKRVFRNILAELQSIYILEIQEMKSRLSVLLKFIVHLGGISNVLEVFESSFKGTLSAQLHDIHHLQESILKTKQHLEIMIWCIRHQFLKNIRSRYADTLSWCSVVRERKSAANKRAWPEVVNQSAESTRQDGSLFIQDALDNLDTEHGLAHEMEEELGISSLQKDGGSSVSGATIEGMAGQYPFDDPRAAVDLLFLFGSSDMVIAKRAIFLYYIFDRHWTIRDEKWRDVVEDFAATFSITRHSLLECLIFYLLDDNADEALQEACHLLPEISGPAIHPKIAKVLLERNNPNMALMVLRWSGRDSGLQMVSITEAVTALRARVECGLLTEAFMHLRMLNAKVREKKLNHGSLGDAIGNLKVVHENQIEWVEILVTEICWLCIRRNLVDRMIELPWNSDEEKYIHACLLNHAIEDPLRNTGNLLVAFYMQRYRYAEAYHIHLKLQKVEQDYMSEFSFGEEALVRIQAISRWRSSLINSSLKLLPEVEQQQLKSGKLPEFADTSQEAQMPSKSDLPEVQDPKAASLLIPLSASCSLLLPASLTSGLLRPSVSETPTKLGGPVNTSFDLGKLGTPPFLHEWLPSNAEMELKSPNHIGKSFRFGNAFTPRAHQMRPTRTSPPKGQDINSSRSPEDDLFNKTSPEIFQNGLLGQHPHVSPLYSHRAYGDSAIKLDRNSYFSKESEPDHPAKMSSYKLQSDGNDRLWNVASYDEPMDISWSHVDKALGVEEMNASGGSRWRSDEMSDNEGEQHLERALGIAFQSHGIPNRRVRSSRFTKR